MKKNSQKAENLLLLFVLISLSVVLIIFSDEAKQGAMEGFALAENTILPSLLPLLIIFLVIMKTGAGAVLSRAFGYLTSLLFNLPAQTTSAIIFGMIGGYPTGALMTCQLFESGDIDCKEAKRLLRFNVCGGCGFIITAVGAVKFGSVKVGAILFASNVLSNLLIGFALSFTEKRQKYEYFDFCQLKSFGNALNEATSQAIGSVLNITAYIVLFSSINALVGLPQWVMPIVEITNGVSSSQFSLPLLCAYLAFGGFCIHFQLLGTMAKVGLKYWDFFLFRVLSAILSYGICKLLLEIFPVEVSVFANDSQVVVSAFSVNIALSILMIVGCFVLVLDVGSKKAFAGSK